MAKAMPDASKDLIDDADDLGSKPLVLVLKPNVQLIEVTLQKLA